MGLRDLFGRRHGLTSGWKEDSRTRLVVDLDRFELGGVGIGEELAKLSFLGPSDSEDSDSLDYSTKGLTVDVHEGRVEAYMLALRHGAQLGSGRDAPAERFAGRIRIGGQDLEPHQLAGENDFASAWGEPYWRDEDEDEILLFFEFPGHEVQVELSPRGEPLVVFFSADPLLADPEQREAYGVTKEWPPTG